MKVKSVSARLATPADAHLNTYDNTKLQAVNVCPTWGILRYDMHKTFENNSRAMALEAGSAMHELFAAVRLYQLCFYDLGYKIDESKLSVSVDDLPDLVKFHGNRLFNTVDNPNRFSDMVEELNKPDERDRCLNFCLQSLYSSGFYDDPSDRRRTMSNLEEAAILYIDRWNFSRYPIWIRDKDDPNSDVGIEIAFDCVLTYTFEDDTIREFRFTGKLDGLQWDKDDLVVCENKTASRIDDAWRLSFEMSSQVTGYALVASVWTELQVGKAKVWGSNIPVPKAYENGLALEHVSRQDYMFARWFDWFLHCVDIYEGYKNDPINAPKYTHSCNRYFRPCSFIPFCVANDEDQRQIIEEMVTEEWSPLDTVQISD